MKRILLALFLSGAWLQSFAQPKNQTFINRRDAGTDYRTNKPLIVREYQFDLPVFKFYPSPNQHMLTVLVRKQNPTTRLWKPSGRLAVIDPETGETQWQRKFNYTGSSIQQVDDVIFEQRPNRLSRLNPADGKAIWKRQSTAYQLLPDLNLALCYEYPTSGFKTLYGININTGQSMWRRDVPAEFGWQRTEDFGDSTMMIVAGGLHTVRLTDGTGWDINRVAHTKKTDMGRVGLAILAGAAGGAMGYMVIPNGNFSDYLLDISSNVLYANDVFYFAAKDQISCHTLDGKAVWKTELNGKKTSKSHLFRDGNTIYMLNMGYGLKYGQQAALGNPYVAAFDAETGKQLFLTEWEERKNYVSDFLIDEGQLYMLYGDKVDIQRFTPEGLTQKYVMRIEEQSKMKRFVHDQIFLKKDSTYMQASLDREHFYLVSEKGELYMFSNEFESLERIDEEKIYKNYLETDRYVFMGNPKETFILDRETNREVARCEAPSTAFRFGNMLYYKKDSAIYELDISAFLSAKFNEN